jgi:hypothetical protein
MLETEKPEAHLSGERRTQRASAGMSRLMDAVLVLAALGAVCLAVGGLLPADGSEAAVMRDSRQAGGASALSSSARADVTLKLGAVTGAAVEPLLGVDSGPLPYGDAGSADVTRQYQEIGVTAIRTHGNPGAFSMSYVYPDKTADPGSRSSYDFALSDRAFRAMLSGGFAPYLRLGDAYERVAPPRTAAERRNWVAAAVNVVRHYTQGLWGGFSAQLAAVEIWNEPDNGHFWPAPLTRTDFFALYEETTTALRAAFPDLRIGGPAFAPAGSLAPQGREYVHAFLTYMHEHGVPLDFVSWHIYSNDHRDYSGGAAFYRAEMRAHGYGAAESHITEWNTSPRGLSPADELAVRSGARGAAIDTAAWIALQQSDVVFSSFFKGQDPSMSAPWFYGLFYADGTPKKPALAFSLWHDFTACERLLGVAVSGSRDAKSALVVLGGNDAHAGKRMLLLANPSALSLTWSASAAGATVGAARLRVYQVSDEDAAVRSFTPAAPVVVMPAYGVQLVAVSR